MLILNQVFMAAGFVVIAAGIAVFAMKKNKN